MKKKIYQAPSMEVIELETKNIVLLSGSVQSFTLDDESPEEGDDFEFQ